LQWEFGRALWGEMEGSRCQQRASWREFSLPSFVNKREKRKRYGTATSATQSDLPLADRSVRESA